MPVWHESIRKWVAEGRLAALGVVQEQHADRCRLFAKWQQFNWPILHDPINILGNEAVPIIVAIDEAGFVRSTRPDLRTFESEFLKKDFSDLNFPPTTVRSERITPPADFAALRHIALETQTHVAWRDVGDALLLWQGNANLDKAIEAYQTALARAPATAARGALLFRLGVAFRRRYESDGGSVEDFARAVQNWKMALDTRPEQYIWRRRIQQYGPRLDKPYPFYDWVSEARLAIQQRGEQPLELQTEPVGAEVAEPAGEVTLDAESRANPDPDGRVPRDEQSQVRIDAVVVPNTQDPRSVMVHLRLALQSGAHWNNEGEPLQVWLDVPEGWQSRTMRQDFAHPADVTSEELRNLEFELQLPRDTPRPAILPGYALYGVCGTAGQCLYLRKDFRVTIE